MKNIGKKAFFFDFDGTIWFGQFGARTLKALKTLKEKGHYIFYNSGRSKGNTYFDKISEISFDGFIFGGCHVEVATKTLFRRDMTKEQMGVALALEEEYDLHIVYEGVNGVYKRNGVTEWRVGEQVNDIRVLLDVEKFPVSKYSIIKTKTEKGEYLPLPKKVIEELEKHFKVVDFENYVECVQKDLGKSVMAQLVVDELKIDMKNVYAFGDSMNDYEMFVWSKNGVAIGHAPEPLKAIAIYVTNEELDGVWEALTHLAII